MTASTRFTSLVGCRLPIQQAGMSGAATAPLAAAVAGAGALGMLGIGRASIASVAVVLDDLDRAVAGLDADGDSGATARVGATCIAPFVGAEVVALLAERLPIVEFFYDWPDPNRVPPGVLCGWQVGSVDEARAAVDAGCAYVIAQGVEAGGHVRGTVPLDALVPAVRQAVDVPIVAAGGIATAAGVRAALALGADAVRIGTRFVATRESNAHPRYVDALVAAGAADTELTEAFGVGWPDAPHRVLRSAVLASAASPSDVVGAMRRADGSSVAMPRFGVSLPTRDTTGDIAAMALYAGTSVGAVRDVPPAADVVAELAAGLAV